MSKRIFTQIMLSSYYIYIILLIACIILLLSFPIFQLRHEIHFNLFQIKEIILISNYYQSQTIISPKEKNLTKNFIDEQTNREKILGTNAKNHSILNRLTFNNPSKLLCNNLQDPNNSMIIVVLSRALNLDYRQAIRATWGRKEKYKLSHISIQTIFFVGTDDNIQSAIRDEQALFNDVVEIGIPEKYSFIAHKELATLFWLRLYCPLVHILFRIDDDILLDIFLLLNHIKYEINLQDKDGIYGWFQINKPVLRLGTLAVTKHEYEPDIYPPYTLSMGYLFSNNSCQSLIDAANHPKHHIIRINDVYITGILRDLAKIPFYTYSNLEYTTTFFNQISCDIHFKQRPHLLSCTSELYTNVDGNPDEYYDIWDRLLIKHNTSLLTF